MMVRIVDMQVDKDGKDHRNRSRGICKNVKVKKSLQIADQTPRNWMEGGSSTLLISQGAATYRYQYFHSFIVLLPRSP